MDNIINIVETSTSLNRIKHGFRRSFFFLTCLNIKHIIKHIIKHQHYNHRLDILVISIHIKFVDDCFQC